MKACKSILNVSVASMLVIAQGCGDDGVTSATDVTETGTSTGTTDETTNGPTTMMTPTTGPAPTTTTDPTTGAPSTATGDSDSTGEPLTGSTADDTSGGTDTTTDGTTGTTGTTGDTTGDTSTGTTGDTTDAGSGTTGAPDGLGAIAGDCGLLDAMELESPSPFVFSNEIDFGVVGYDYDLLTAGGQQIKDEGGLNDGSLDSEIVAYEVLARCDMAVLLKTEGTIVYTDPMGKKTDLLVELDGLKVGVSVVRAIGFPQDDPYTVAQAETILKKKLGDIAISSTNVAPEDAWVKQILSVVAYGPMHVESVLAAYAGLDPLLKADTILVVTVTHGDDAFIY